ncbi:DUF72 domain-containing protein [Evansella sp. AB-P1]|uniref:DUF72 domain-containing protein n=1 Tax=Evansella sp. AB-P1 TaxID=3037653 RepID=UPI00241D61B1|nr:DUF72 domain-containing protein [Evansella sp. AB-P1]MDG5788917.1 DUF72 domain-containing protein [Evansella sp. AB-P1]
MIWVGLTGWGDHIDLYEGILSASKEKLKTYAGHFPIVEVDTSFYAIQSERNMTKWVNDTPESFRFIVKAYQGITGHQRGDIPFQSKKEMFEAFKLSLKPIIEGNKLAAILCQFPPWFDCRREHVDYLRYCREAFADLDVALEFRHQSWFLEDYRHQTLEYMKKDKWIHSICDEPQAGKRSIPFVPTITTVNKSLFRFHGRNVHGWTKPVKGQDWRDVRYLYDYNDKELKELASTIRTLSKETKQCYVLFNNNSGGHAAKNAKDFIKILGLTYTDLAPRQLGLFD